MALIVVGLLQIGLAFEQMNTMMVICMFGNLVVYSHIDVIIQEI